MVKIDHNPGPQASLNQTYVQCLFTAFSWNPGPKYRCKHALVHRPKFLDLQDNRHTSSFE